MRLENLLVFVLSSLLQNEFARCAEEEEAGFCSADSESCKPVCKGQRNLENLLDQEIGSDNIFFLETGPKQTITGREACALESAVGQSGLHVIMVRANRTLDLADNSTCYISSLFSSSHSNKLSIFYLDFEEIAKGTPLENFYTSEALVLSYDYKYAHVADALRLLLVQKYGGFYADTDYVITKPLTGLQNVLASDQVTEDELNAEGHILQGYKVSNAMFHFKKDSPLLECAIRKFVPNYLPHVWAHNGPDLLQTCLTEVCGFDGEIPANKMTSEDINREKCQGVQLLSYRSFYPFAWLSSIELHEQRKTKKEWNNYFDRSYAVHFYHSSRKNMRSLNGEHGILTPEYYGARKPAYLVLALQYCPISYNSVKPF